MDPNYLITQIFNGIVLGMILVLISLGLTIIFGLLDIINFAHGDILLLGAYASWTLIDVTGSFVVGVLGAVLVTAVLGALMMRYLVRPLQGRDQLLVLLATFGFAEFLRGGVQVIWGRTGRSIDIPSWASGNFDFGLFTYPQYQTLVVVAAVAIVVGIYLWLTRTNYGLIVRAATSDREMVDALGIDISRIYILVFALGAALAGVAGALIAPIRGAYPTLGIELLTTTFVVVVIGGLGSFAGSVVAGLAIGEVMVLTGIAYSPATNIIIFVLMALILLVRPQGLFGEEVRG